MAGSKTVYELHGSVHRNYCFFWGIAAVVWIRYGYPLVAKLMANLKKHILPWMTVVLTVFMAVNMGLSGLALAAVVIVFLLLAALYVGYQAMQVLFPPNTYETALLATVEDTVDAEGVLLFEESYVAGGGTLGYLVADGERVSAGTAVAEIYSDAAQATLRQQLTQINDQIMHIKYPIGHGQTEQRIKFNTLSYPTFLSVPNNANGCPGDRCWYIPDICTQFTAKTDFIVP